MSFWDDKKPKEENFANKEDIKKLGRDIEKLSETQEPTTIGARMKLATSITKGLGDVAKSLASPKHNKRMRIAQMPGSKPPIVTTKVSNPVAGKNAGIHRGKISDAPDN